jgi:hypothetical protein
MPGGMVSDDMPRLKPFTFVYTLALCAYLFQVAWVPAHLIAEHQHPAEVQNKSHHDHHDDHDHENSHSHYTSTVVDVTVNAVNTLDQTNHDPHHAEDHEIDPSTLQKVKTLLSYAEVPARIDAGIASVDDVVQRILPLCELPPTAIASALTQSRAPPTV